MHKASALFATILALSACGSGKEQAAPAPSAGPAKHPAPTPAAISNPGLTSAAELAGEYRVAAIDGAPFDESYGVAVTIAGDRLSYEPVCSGFDWTIGFDGGLMRTERRIEPPLPGEVQPRPVCAVASPPRLQQLGLAIDAATGAMRTPENGILLSGGGRSVLLFSQ